MDFEHSCQFGEDNDSVVVVACDRYRMDRRKTCLPKNEEDTLDVLVVMVVAVVRG